MIKNYTWRFVHIVVKEQRHFRSSVLKNKTPLIHEPCTDHHKYMTVRSLLLSQIEMSPGTKQRMLSEGKLSLLYDGNRVTDTTVIYPIRVIYSVEINLFSGTKGRASE